MDSVKPSARRITVNGEQVAWEPGMTVNRVLEVMHYTFRMIVVKVNGQLIKREDYQTRLIPAGARVEVIHLVAGG